MGFRARFVGHLIGFAGQQGADTGALLRISGLTQAQLADDTLFVDVETYSNVVEQAAHLTGDRHFGLHMGEFMSLAAAGLIAQITQSCGTVGAALHYMVEFANLGCQEFPFSLVKGDQAWELALNPAIAWQQRFPEAARHTMDGMIVFTLREFDALVHGKYHPRQISFSYAEPDELLEYRRLFQCPVVFDQEKTAIYLQKHHLDLPVVSADYDLLSLLVKYAHEKLARLESEHGFATTVRKSILNLVKPQFPTIDAVASNLNMSVRTLQRRLKSSGQTYQSIVNQLRRQLATDYLKSPDLSIKEIAYLLSYSESSAFVRSFRRWYDTSPAQYRKQLLSNKQNRP